MLATAFAGSTLFIGYEGTPVLNWIKKKAARNINIDLGYNHY
jgi:hypothetical protein